MKHLVIIVILLHCLAFDLSSQDLQNKTEKSSKIERLNQFIQDEAQKNEADTSKPEENVDQSETIDPINKLIEAEKKDKEQSIPIIPQGSSIAMLDDATKEQYFAALNEYYKYRISGYKHRQEVFYWQLLSSKIIFVVVIFLVLVGIYFSGVQFHSSLKWKRSKGVGEKEEATSIEASIKGIKVSSPILGIIILVISFLFFYLYLAHVYPIEEIF